VAGEFEERRRTPRVAVEGRREFRLGRRLRVRVLDISASGVLIAADDRLPVGSAVRLQITLGGSQFEGQLVVKREQTAHDGKSHLCGAVVTPSQPRHQDALEQFLRRAGN
jgi:hypothetical protein